MSQDHAAGASVSRIRVVTGDALTVKLSHDQILREFALGPFPSFNTIEIGEVVIARDKVVMIEEWA